jgi:transposase InsO family protein
VSKARLVITAVVVEGRSQAEVARCYGVSKGWVSKLLACYRLEGEAAFEQRSRRPLRSPRQLSEALVESMLMLRRELSSQGLDAGPSTIAWHLAQRHRVKVAAATISRYLNRAGLIKPQPRKRPRSSYVRFAAAMPNETWQSDFTYVRLATGQDVKVLTWLDDCSRFALSVTAHEEITGPLVLASFRAVIARYGTPASTLTDNGMVYTTRFSGGRGGRSALEHELRQLGVVQKNSRPNHPTTCGKVERFQQTLKKWLAAQCPQPTNLEALQALLDAFVSTYNRHRPHRSLPHRATPQSVYQSLPKARPGDRAGDSHNRVRHDRIDKAGIVTLRHNGRLHHIGVGRIHAHTPVILLVQDPPHSRRRHRHRRTTPRTHPQPQPRLPRHRQTTRTNTKKTSRTIGSAVSYLSRDDIGGSCRTRTYNPLIKSQLLCQLS